ncbi:MAG: hypothetical protein CM1200mP26_17850 [Acidimicrobiales bacterium]|nr:MAG: hypothetical protein CM1200mP26_17850 [Acidimicrobiales bacterium]
MAALNKIDLPPAEPDRYAEEIEQVLGYPPKNFLHISAKTGRGWPNFLTRRRTHPPPFGDLDPPPSGPRFDSHFDQSRGRGFVLSALSRERLAARDSLRFMQANAFPQRSRDRGASPRDDGGPGTGPREVGYLLPGDQRRPRSRSGETFTTSRNGSTDVLDGYREPQPMVFSGLYPIDGTIFNDLREALEKLRFNDSSFTYEPETSGALGFGFRCGFLGLLHMEIVRERRETGVRPKSHH